MADKILKQMLDEFVLASRLEHPNIVKYRYFVRQYIPETKLHQFHILIEYTKGEDLNKWLKGNGKMPIEKIKVIGKEILKSIKYMH